jgi:L-cystine uptake protein TcyP (sodium:dicarboxylate symporter family)
MAKFLVSFAEFVKHTDKAILFLALIAMAYLYTDNKKSNTKQIQYYQERIDKLENQVLELQKTIIDLTNKTRK